MFVFGIAIIVKVGNLQFVEGEKYRAMASKRIVKDFVVPANRGNLYSVNGNLLATSVPKYDIRLDAKTTKANLVDKYLKALSDSLSKFPGKYSSGHYRKKIREAIKLKKTGLLLANNLAYPDYLRVRSYPILNEDPNKGGLVVERKTKREYPMGVIARRTIGHERTDGKGNLTRPGIDGFFGEKYLRGKDGIHARQEISNDQWKPIVDYNKIDPKDGLDIYTTIDVNIQDIAHHSLLQQLKYYEADHGCVVVMEVETGEIRAISNLGITQSGNYYERQNYAVGESHEPGSTFKVMALMAALEDKVIDTSSIIDTKNGEKMFYGRTIYDSHKGGFGKISAAKAVEVSSNIGLATIINDNYAKNPKAFLKYIDKWCLSDTLGLPIIGEGKPVIYRPKDKLWSKNALPSMAYGYNLQLTPLQTLTFYNAIANNGVMVKPVFIKTVREFDRIIKNFDKKIINKRICSDKTLSEIQHILKRVVEKGTGKKLYTSHFSMSGKTGTTRAEYWKKDWKDNKRYISSFAGYFPSENPKYSCIVVIHKPIVKKGFFGVDVSGPVFKTIAQKIYSDTPLIDEIKDLDIKQASVIKDFENYTKIAEKYKTIMPNVVGLQVMDAVALLENMGLKVNFKGSGVVKKQSIVKGKKIKKNQKVVLEIS